MTLLYLWSFWLKLNSVSWIMSALVYISEQVSSNWKSSWALTKPNLEEFMRGDTASKSNFSIFLCCWVQNLVYCASVDLGSRWVFFTRLVQTFSKLFFMVLKSNNLQYNRLGCWVDGTNNLSTAKLGKIYAKRHCFKEQLLHFSVLLSAESSVLCFCWVGFPLSFVH